MRRMRKAFTLFLSFALITACSATPRKRSVGEVIDDSVISSKLKVKYLKDKSIKGFKINIDTWKGVVTLKGKVEGQRQIDRAVDIAERQPGVKEVKSYLIVKGPSKKTVSQGPIEETSVAETREGAPEEPLADSEEPKPHFDDEPNLDIPSQITQ